MSILDRALHIPVEPRFLEPPTRALERVLLPLEARLSWRLALVAAVAFLIAGACIALGGAVGLSSTIDPGENVFKFTAAAFFLLSAVTPACVVLTAIADWRRRGPCLIVNGDGVFDARLGAETIRWSDIARAEILSSVAGACTVRLTLATPSGPVFNPFRPGGWSARWTERHTVRVVALLLLDRRPHIIAQTIAALATRHGIEVEQPPPLVFPGF